MHKLSFSLVLTCLVFMSFSALAQRPKLTKEQDAMGKEIATNVGTCTAYEKAQGPIKTKIHGLVDGKCKYTQTLPRNQIMECNFSEENRNAIKAKGMPAMEGMMTNKEICQMKPAQG